LKETAIAEKVKPRRSFDSLRSLRMTSFLGGAHFLSTNDLQLTTCNCLRGEPWVVRELGDSTK